MIDTTGQSEHLSDPAGQFPGWCLRFHIDKGDIQDLQSPQHLLEHLGVSIIPRVAENEQPFEIIDIPATVAAEAMKEPAIEADAHIRPACIVMKRAADHDVRSVAARSDHDSRSFHDLQQIRLSIIHWYFQFDKSSTHIPRSSANAIEQVEPLYTLHFYTSP
jgi:hypothetical protein